MTTHIKTALALMIGVVLGGVRFADPCKRAVVIASPFIPLEVDPFV
jgi:hypothetical protein